MADHVMVPVAVGELFDKISILKIKLERIEDPAKLANVGVELRLLEEIARDLPYITLPEVVELCEELKGVNEAIWDAENRVRQVARREGFGKSFAEVAKVTYQNNDRRAAIKRRLSLLAGSPLLEEKSHTDGVREPASEVDVG